MRLPIHPKVYAPLKRMWAARQPIHTRALSHVMPQKMPKILQVVRPTYGRQAQVTTKQGAKFMGKTFLHAAKHEALHETGKLAVAAGVEHGMNIAGYPSHGIVSGIYAAIETARKMRSAAKFAALPWYKRAGKTLAHDYKPHMAMLGGGVAGGAIGTYYTTPKKRS